MAREVGKGQREPGEGWPKRVYSWKEVGSGVSSR